MCSDDLLRPPGKQRPKSLDNAITTTITIITIITMTTIIALITTITVTLSSSWLEGFRRPEGTETSRKTLPAVVAIIGIMAIIITTTAIRHCSRLLTFEMEKLEAIIAMTTTTTIAIFNIMITMKIMIIMIIFALQVRDIARLIASRNSARASDRQQSHNS